MRVIEQVRRDGSGLVVAVKWRVLLDSGSEVLIEASTTAVIEVLSQGEAVGTASPAGGVGWFVQCRNGVLVDAVGAPPGLGLVHLPLF